MSRTPGAVSSVGAAKSLVKGIELIDLVEASTAPPRVVDLVERSGLPRPTVVRLLDVLRDTDVLRAESTGGYVLGPRVVGWGQSFLDRIDLRRHASELLRVLVRRCGETCYIGVLDGSAVLYIAAEHSPHAVRPAACVGSRIPLHSTSIGKVLLACRDRTGRETLLGDRLERHTDNTITDRDEFERHLDDVREHGYAVDEIENEHEVRGIAAPIMDHQGATVAGLAVSAPAHRFSVNELARLVPQVRRSARDISASMGYRPDGSAP